MMPPREASCRGRRSNDEAVTSSDRVHRAAKRAREVFCLATDLQADHANVTEPRREVMPREYRS
jgi:hypothetical protein